MKHIFIVNPAAGKRDQTGESSREIQELCRELGVDYGVYKTSWPGHATELVKEIGQSDPEEYFRFYACGGDGTLNEVVNGVAHLDNAAFTHFPMGTGNDFIKVFGREQDKFRDLRQLIEGEEIPMDYIQSSELDAINIVSVGIDARVADGMGKYKKLLTGIGPYLVSTAENVLKGIGEQLEVLADGVRYDGSYSMVCLINGLCYGGGFTPVPEAKINDGRLELLLVRKVTRLQAAAVVAKYKQGRYKELPQYITCLYPKEVRIRAVDHRMVANFDGEIRHLQDVTFRLADKKLNLVVPKGVRP